METKRLIIFVLLSFAILFGWQHFYAPKPVQATIAETQTADGKPVTDVPAAVADNGKLQQGSRIKVVTDMVIAEIDTMGGDLRKLSLIKHGQIDDAKQPFVLLQDSGDHTYVALTGLINGNVANLPTHRTLFTSDVSEAKLENGKDSVAVRLEAPVIGGVKVAKIYTFKRGSYVIDVKYEINNGSTAALDTSAYFSLRRDSVPPKGSNERFGTSTFTGPAIFTDASKFKKLEFKDIEKDKAEHVLEGQDGWVAMLQHYFASAWLLSPSNGNNVCKPKNCQFKVEKKPDGLFEVAAVVKVPTVAAGASGSLSVPLYAGPEETRALEAAAPGLDLVKDYGIFKVIAQPMFWLLSQIHGVIGNWGWAIVVFTLLIKLAFYPLAVTQYRSMAKMKKLAPRMQRLKEQYGDDRMKFQQAVMELYKSEKANPLSGCLPLLIQMPIFLGLFYMLQAVVELRHAGWMLWVHDLSVADPYYVLPVLMAISMYVQTLFNPPSADPMQDKMMKIMPLVFSFMFLFFPAGLVLYYVVNNTFSIAQQWYITRQIENADKAKA
ncbi:membrane protein insertase YidC [Chitinimonas sp.]|uniref:membrane protein insertase YidC n=1 Tax=Chitinimonas sp. TaxID=1934313 RepID=UPI0035B31B47